MTLLALEGIARGHRHGGGDRSVLRNVSLELDEGEVVAIWGQRRSGRSTLLRIAAGIERPDDGTVRFTPHLARTHARAHAGHPRAHFPASTRPHVLQPVGDGIGYGQRELSCVEAGTVIDELIVCALARGLPLGPSRAHAGAILERVGGSEYAQYSLRELDSLEATLAMIAQALVGDPRLLVVDEPTKGMDLGERERVMALLHSLAGAGRTVLLSTGEATALSRADRALTLSDGEVHGSAKPELAEVLPLLRRAEA